MKHIDLFSGIGGFALAVDTVWPGSEHIFCDFDPFCQQVLNKHWPKSKIYDNIRTFATDPDSVGRIYGELEKQSAKEYNKAQCESVAGVRSPLILTGGFPCQPFSAAGKRKGTEDNRYLWPEMFRIIQTFKPTWIIAENVRGLVTWNDGMVLEQVCTDLEGQGYEVQPLIIPAVAVNAPHRRDRIWFIAHKHSSRPQKPRTRKQAIGFGQLNENIAYTKRSGLQRGGEKRQGQRGQLGGDGGDKGRSWNENWLEVATELCGVDDGLPTELDGFKLTKASHRAARLKALGNAIVPQVAIEIMKAIKLTN